MGHRAWRLLAAVACASAVLAGWFAGHRLPPGAEAVRRYLEAHPDFLVDHPHLIEQARPIALERRAAEIRQRRQEVVALSEIVRQGEAPRLGGAPQPLVVLEFTDYACVPCKAIAARLEAIMAAHPQVQLVVLYVPGADAAAESAARAALAVWGQEPTGFAAVHRALMAAPLRELPAAINEVLRGDNAVCAQRCEQAASPEVRETLRRMRALADELGVRGVPSFVADGSLLTGSGALDTLQQSIELATRNSPQ